MEIDYTYIRRMEKWEETKGLLRSSLVLIPQDSEQYLMTKELVDGFIEQMERQMSHE